MSDLCFAHHIATLGEVVKAPVVVSPQSRHLMPHEIERSQRRKMVLRMIGVYLRLRQEASSVHASAAIKAIHETRLPKDSGGSVKAVLSDENLSDIERIDALYRIHIRSAVTRKPEKRTDVQYGEEWGADNAGRPMRCVAPTRDVVQIVRSRTDRRAAVDDKPSRAWQLTVGAKLQRIVAWDAFGRARVRTLLEAEQIRLDLITVRNRLAQARSAQQRRRGSENRQATGNASAEIVRDLAADEKERSDRLRSLVRTGLYRDAVDLMWRVCNESRDVASYCFREFRF